MLSTLSPCVLPLLPLVLGGVAAAHRFGMLALAAGLVVSFVGVGMFVATIGFSIGLDADVFRIASTVLLAGLGVVLLSGQLQVWFAIVASGVGNAGNRLLARLAPGGLGGQLVIGLVLGAIWSPCVGPTLGAASMLAAQGKSLGAVTLVMAAFGLGAALPLLLVGSLSREAMKRWRGRMLGAGQSGKTVLGGAAVLVALLIVTGWDKLIEAALVRASPAWRNVSTTLIQPGSEFKLGYDASIELGGAGRVRQRLGPESEQSNRGLGIGMWDVLALGGDRHLCHQSAL